jgi:hypothetical protein
MASDPPYRQAIDTEAQTHVCLTAVTVEISVWLKRAWFAIEMFPSCLFDYGKGVPINVNIGWFSQHNLLLC